MRIIFLGDSLTHGTIGASYFSILQNKIPKHKLINYGKNGDTTAGLLKRMKKIDLKDPIDIVFLWIGVNDILIQISWSFPIKNKLYFQPWSKTCIHLEKCYTAILEILTTKAQKVYTVSPLFIGENILNPWNVQLTTVSRSINELSTHYKNVNFIDLRKKFKDHLLKNPSSNFIQKSTISGAIDAIKLRTCDKIDAKAKQRGLQFTMDGIHLNSAGAQIVAEVFSEKIRKKIV